MAENETGTALAVSNDGQLTPAEMFKALISASENPNVDPGKMTALVDLQIRVMEYRKQEQFNQDKAAAINAMPTIDKKGRIVNDGKLMSRFSRWEDLHAQVMPILKQFNLVISHLIGHTGNGMVTVTPVLSHANGYTETGKEMALPIEDSGFKNKAQGVGSAASYGQRYTTVLMLNIRQQNADDDAQSTAGKGGRKLNQTEEMLISDGNAAAKKGSAAYVEWFQSLSAAERGWLVTSGRHAEMKQAAGA